MASQLDSQAAELLDRVTGRPTSAFRDGQLEAIRTLVDDRGRVLVVQRTGWGKSAVYFIATRLLRDRGAGASLLISPLLALMRNQIDMAHRAGVEAATINSDNREEWDQIEHDVSSGRVDLLLVSPERLNNPRFRSDVLPALLDRVGMLVVDEAHCISDWGHDFRPDYRRIGRVLDLLPSTVPVLCTTATANQRVVDDIALQLGAGLEVVRGTLDRESLRLSVVTLPNPSERLAWLARMLPQLPGSGIVYCLTIRDAERVAEWLRSEGVDALAYTGESESAHRLDVEEALVSNTVKVVVATSALGMGYDKPDLGFVVHYQSPGSPVAYYQQVGRAGRALHESFGILLAGNEDVDIQDYFIETAFPREEQASAVLDFLAAQPAPASERSIQQTVNVKPTRLQTMLKVLEVEGAVQRSPGSGWLRTAQPWTYDADRVARVTAARRAEQAAMFEYIRTRECLMAFLRTQLDDTDVRPCGRCANCTGEQWDVPLPPEEVARARSFLRRSWLVIEPRKQWMDVIPELPFTIPQAQQLQEGRCLSAYNDGGWGTVVRRAKYDEGSFPAELVTAAAAVIQAWAPVPPPTWVTWVPSTSTPELVPDFARRLATTLGLPAVDCVSRVRRSRPQKEMENSPQQLTNVYGAFAVPNVPPTGPVLLIDDIYDSKWTLTVVGAELRRAGSGPVYPFALAKAEGS